MSLGVSSVKSLGDKANKISGLDVKDTASYYSKATINNHRELLYSGTKFRSFSFDFRFVPQSEEEAINVKNIIQCLRFYASCEISPNFAGRILLYPAEFDIFFYSHGIENGWINKISTCALEGITVNETPTGNYVAHRPTSDGTMAPSVVTDLQLRFRELEFIHKSLVLQNF